MRPLSTRVINVRWAQGHANDTYKWYLFASGANLEPGALEMKSLNEEALLLYAPSLSANFKISIFCRVSMGVWMVARIEKTYFRHYSGVGEWELDDGSDSQVVGPSIYRLEIAAVTSVPCRVMPFDAL